MEGWRRGTQKEGGKVGGKDWEEEIGREKEWPVIENASNPS